MKRTMTSGDVVRIPGAVAVFVALAAGCTLPSQRPSLPSTPMEQLLISEAVERGMQQLSLELPEGSRLHVESTGLDAAAAHVARVLEGWLGRRGFAIEPDPQAAEFTARLVAKSVGTVRNVRLFGLPAVQVVWLPVSLPELALYKRNRQQGYTRFYLDVFETGTGRHVTTTSDCEGSARHVRHTLLFVIQWTNSDLPEPSGRGDIDLTDPG